MNQYPGVYRAKAVQVVNGVITAYVPQVLGDQPVTITSALGGFPTGPSIGWVLFEAGLAERPVWSTGTIVGFDVLGIEVQVSPDPPTNENILLWYDTDATYPDVHYTTTAEATSISAASVAAHVALTDPHPTYTTNAEVTALAVALLAKNRVICTSTTRPTPAIGDVGLAIFETDTLSALLWSGSSWIYVNDPRSVATLPVIGLFDGLMRYLTTTKRLNRYNAATTSWVPIDAYGETIGAMVPLGAAYTGPVEFRGGTFVGTTNGSGDIFIPIPNPKTGILACGASPGDTGLQFYVTAVTSDGPSRIIVRARQSSDGTTLVTGAIYRYSWWALIY